MADQREAIGFGRYVTATQSGGPGHEQFAKRTSLLFQKLDGYADLPCLTSSPPAPSRPGFVLYCMYVLYKCLPCRTDGLTM
jgi:hypothetical protein